MQLAFYRDIENLLRIFSVCDERLLYNYVYLHYLHINKTTKMFSNELEVLTRYAWKYRYLTLKEFKQYYWKNKKALRGARKGIKKRSVYRCFPTRLMILWVLFQVLRSFLIHLCQRTTYRMKRSQDLHGRYKMIQSNPKCSIANGLTSSDFTCLHGNKKQNKQKQKGP